MRTAVIDTNVLVSGLLIATNPPGRILDQILSGEIQVVCDDRIFLEYRQVLSRPRFGFETHDVVMLLEFFQFSGMWVNAPSISVELPDPNDQPFIEVAIASQAPLITGNIRHYPLQVIQQTSIQIFSPSEFLKHMMS